MRSKKRVFTCIQGFGVFIEAPASKSNNINVHNIFFSFEKDQRKEITWTSNLAKYF